MIDNHSIMHKLILTPHLYEKPGDQNRHPGVPAARCAFGGRQNYSWERERWRTLLIWSVTEYIASYFHMKQELSADQQLKVNKATTAGESITHTSRSLSENIHSSSHETHTNRRHSTCWTDEDTHTHNLENCLQTNKTKTFCIKKCLFFCTCFLSKVNIFWDNLGVKYKLNVFIYTGLFTNIRGSKLHVYANEAH